MGTSDSGYADGWRPSPGDKIVGRVVALDIGSSAYGEYPIVTIERDDDHTEVAVHAFHQGLRSRLEALRPKAGERIGIQYHGEEVTKSDRRFHRYTTRLEGRDVDVWSALSGSAIRSSGHEWTERIESARPAQPETPQVPEDDIPF